MIQLNLHVSRKSDHRVPIFRKLDGKKHSLREEHMVNSFKKKNGLLRKSNVNIKKIDTGYYKAFPISENF